MRRLEQEIAKTTQDRTSPGYERQTDRRIPETLYQTTDSGYGSNRPQYDSKVDGPAQLEASLGAVAELVEHDELRTVYSDTDSLRDPVILDYVSAFADELFQSLPSGFDAAEFQRVSAEFDELLRAFSFIVGADGNKSEHRKLMYLVHRYRSQIISNLEQRYNEPLQEYSDPDLMPIEEKMSVLWRERDENILDDEPGDHPDAEFVDEDDAVFGDLPDLGTYRELIYNSSAFQWLRSRIGVADKLECPGPINIQTHIRGFILETIGQQKKFSRGTIPSSEIKCIIEWNIFDFHLEQEYSCSPEDILKQAVTVTGFRNDVQAATCFDYVEQTWGSTGTRILQALHSAVTNSLTNDKAYGNILLQADAPAEASIDVTCLQGELAVVASGLPYSVAEVGEVLAWITAALQQSPHRTTAASCTPVVEFQAKDNDFQSASEGRQRPQLLCLCIVGGKLQEFNHIEPDSVAQCWLNMFRNPVIVNGYPIPRRIRAGTGLEVSIEIMALLTNARYLIDFNRRTFLKGLSTMLAITEVVESTIFWHLYYDTDGGYISYENPQVPRLRETMASLALNHDQVVRCRHILGWCGNVSTLFGTRQASYDIGWSKLLRPRTTFAFDKVSISGGKFVNIGTTVSIGIKDKPEHIKYDDDYLSTLEMITERHFLFYDIAARRAWLVDGASAVLHLMRAFIKRSLTKSHLKSYFLLDENEIKEPSDGQTGVDAAFYVLADEENQMLKLWPKAASSTKEMSMKPGNHVEEVLKHQTSYYCFKDRVMQICHILQQITAHQDDVYSRDGVGSRIKLSPRRQLEGFDFMDVATETGTLWPRVGYLSVKGEGWVDLARELHSVALLGTGFGELMKPEGNPCWQCMANIPQEPDLLGLTVQDLYRIMEKRGDQSGKTWRVVENIHWYVPDKLHEPCQCDSTSTTRHDRVQIFLPARHPKLGGRHMRKPQLLDSGAILLGHSFKYPLRWGSRSKPQEGEPDLTVDKELLNAEGSSPSRGIRSRLHLEVPGQSLSLGGSSQDNQQFVSASSSETAAKSNSELLAPSTNSTYTIPDSASRKGKRREGTYRDKVSPQISVTDS
ncbi:hypothetical protein PG985_001525 [Apiospora marii]|uniref:Pfs domain protein n=1 Tax=Apiospora marii TaxID=335849 RepID=A0ABR1RI66_9PEZI